MRGDEYFIALSGKNMNISQMPFTKYVSLFALGCGLLIAGILIGFWIGQTSLGTLLPHLLAVGTVISFMTAVYFAIYHPNSRQDYVGNTAFLLFSLTICAVVLGSSISATAAWQLFPADSMAGFIPYSDASAYYQQVLEWPAQTFNAWNSRRPLNATLNIMEFHLGGRTLLGMILVRVVLAALAITAFIVALASVAGRAAAMTAGFVLLIWTWPYASSMMSEINGITLSAAGYALLLVALTQKQRTLAVLGLFALVLAYTFRPYNPLMPALFAFFVMLCLAKDWRKGLKIALLAAFAATLLVVVLPKTIYLVYGDPDGSPNANTSSTLLGLARGTGWKEASEYVGSIAPGLSEKKMSALMNELAIEAVKKDMRPLSKALIVNLAKAVYFSQQELGSAMGFSNQIVGNAQNSPGEFIRFVTQHPTIWITSLIALLSVMLLFWTLKSCLPVALLGGVSVISFITIAPVVFGDGSWRVVASLYPGLALLATAIPLSIRHARCSRMRTETTPTQFLKATVAPQFASYVPIALIGFVLIAMPYPAVSRLFAGDAKPLSDALILDVGDNETPHWTGLNRAVVSASELLDWSIEEEHGEWAAFLLRYGKSITQVYFENGSYVLLANDKVGIPAQSDLPKDPVFQLRIVQK